MPCSVHVSIAEAGARREIRAGRVLHMLASQCPELAVAVRTWRVPHMSALQNSQCTRLHHGGQSSQWRSVPFLRHYDEASKRAPHMLTLWKLQCTC